MMTKLREVSAVQRPGTVLFPPTKAARNKTVKTAPKISNANMENPLALVRSYRQAHCFLRG